MQSEFFQAFFLAVQLIFYVVEKLPGKHYLGGPTETSLEKRRDSWSNRQLAFEDLNNIFHRHPSFLHHLIWRKIVQVHEVFHQLEGIAQQRVPRYPLLRRFLFW